MIDSQSFPLEVAGFPLLSEKGAYDSSSVYTLEDVQSIISYANEVSRLLNVRSFVTHGSSCSAVSMSSWCVTGYTTYRMYFESNRT